MFVSHLVLILNYASHARAHKLASKVIGSFFLTVFLLIPNARKFDRASDSVRKMLLLLPAKDVASVPLIDKYLSHGQRITETSLNKAFAAQQDTLSQILHTSGLCFVLFCFCRHPLPSSPSLSHACSTF